MSWRPKASSKFERRYLAVKTLVFVPIDGNAVHSHVLCGRVGLQVGLLSSGVCPALS